MLWSWKLLHSHEMKQQVRNWGGGGGGSQVKGGSASAADVVVRLMQSHPSVQWFMWMDTDALFTNLTFAFPFHTYSAWGKHFIVPSSLSKVKQNVSLS